MLTCAVSVDDVIGGVSPGRKEVESPSIIESTRRGDNYAVQSYLKYQGEKFIERGFDANTYLALTNQMDTHDVSRGRGTYLKVLNSITIPALIVGITSDVLYPIVEQQELAEHLGNAVLKLVDSEEGHDGFLLEQSRIGQV